MTMDDKTLRIPKQEQSHDHLPPIANINNLLASYLLGQIENANRQEISDDITGMGELIETIERLGSTPFDEATFDKHCAELLDSKSNTISKMKLSQQETALRRGHVTIFDTDESDEIIVNVAARHTEAFREAQTQALMLHGTEISEADFPIYKEDHTLETIFGSIFDKFGAQIAKAIKRLPNENALVKDLMNGQIIIPDLFPQQVLQPQEISIAPDNKELRNVKRELRKTNEMIQAYIDNPEAVLADVYMTVVSEELEEYITNNVQDSLVRANTRLYSELESPRDNAPKEPESTAPITKRERRIVDGIALAARAATQKSVEDLRDKPQEWPKTTHSVVVSSEWLHPQERNVQEIITPNGSVYVFEGIADELIAIRDATIAKINKIPGKINTAAEKIAQGNLPWTTHNTFKRLDLGDKPPVAYKDESIYYIPDKSPNAPRIYFTVKRAGALEVVYPDRKPILDPEQWCMTIVAITDKAQQIDTLQSLTGKTRKQLIADGAGSI